jgi:hypothetical protein
MAYSRRQLLAFRAEGDPEAQELLRIGADCSHAALLINIETLFPSLASGRI